MCEESIWIAAAFGHVWSHHPNVARVTYYQDDPDCGGVWLYENADGSVPRFGDEVDTNVLERALDAAWELKKFPASFSAQELGSLLVERVLADLKATYPATFGA